MQSYTAKRQTLFSRTPPLMQGDSARFALVVGSVLRGPRRREGRYAQRGRRDEAQSIMITKSNLKPLKLSAAGP